MLSEGAESFTVTLGTITTSLPATQVTAEDRRLQRDGDDSGERPDHGEHLRAVECE